MSIISLIVWFGLGVAFYLLGYSHGKKDKKPKKKEGGQNEEKKQTNG